MIILLLHKKHINFLFSSLISYLVQGDGKSKARKSRCHMKNEIGIYKTRQIYLFKLSSLKCKVFQKDIIF